MSGRPFRIAIDMDDTAYDLTTPWLRWYNAKWSDKLTPLDVTSWEWEEFVKEEARGKVYDFLHIEGMFEALEPMQGCINAVKAVSRWNVEQIFLSTCKTRTGGYEKMQAVKRDFPFIGIPKVMISGGDKQYIDCDVLVDDGPHNLIAWKADGKITVKANLFNTPNCVKGACAETDITMTDWSQYPAIIDELLASAGS